MKSIINNIFLLLLLSVVAFSVKAQTIYKGQITVNTQELSQKEDSLIINIDVDLSGLAMDNDRSLSLIPMLVTKDTNRELPYILVNGSRRHKFYKREQALNKNAVDAKTVYAVVKADKNVDQKIAYRLSLPFEDWMKDARLDMKEDLCGCAGHTQQIAIDNLAASVSMEVEPRYDLKPMMSFIRPEVEELKKRSEQREAFLDFPVARTEIDPGYMNNPRELEKIESMLKELRDDKNLTVGVVAITGFASPEGNVSFNNTLSQKRAGALRSYLSAHSEFPANVYNVEQGGEDWIGLERLVEESSMENKNEVLSVIRSGRAEDAREQSLKLIGGGSTYQKMLKDLFPRLRRVMCRVDYTVRGFNVEEAKEIIKRRPQQLSLEEMFLVANSYDMDDKEFAEVFNVAVRMYPEDEVANLNAAATALKLGDTGSAKSYLDKVSTTNKEYTNNLGVYYLLTGEYDKARELFNRAIRAGVENAKHNLSELERKIEIEGL